MFSEQLRCRPDYRKDLWSLGIQKRCSFQNLGIGFYAAARMIFYAATRI